MILTPLQKLPKIGAIELLPKALKSCPKSNKSPNLVTLIGMCFDITNKALTFWFGTWGPGLINKFAFALTVRHLKVDHRTLTVEVRITVLLVSS